MENPIFSIIIPTYNRKELLKEALDSVFNQNFKGPYEIIVVDDGSIDGTWEYLEEISKKKGNLVITRHEENKGVGKARNTGVRLAKGNYLFFLDSDDLLDSKALQKAYEIIQSSAPLIILCSVYILKKGSKKLKTFPEPSPDPFQRLKDYLDGIYSDARFFFKKELFEESLFPELGIREDWVFKAKNFTLYSAYILKEPIVIMREHPNRLRYRLDLYLKYIFLSVDLLFSGLPEEFKSLYPYAMAKAFMELGTKFAQAKDYKNAFKSYKKSLEYEPSFKKDFKFLKKFLKSMVLQIFY